jgi:L-lactate dehydrogenase (cytochrome)
MLPFLPQMLVKPRWLAGFRRRRTMVSNVVLTDRSRCRMPKSAARSSRRWSVGRLHLDPRRVEGADRRQGLHTGEDARCAIDHGAAAVIVQSRRTSARWRRADAARAAGVLEAVGDRTEVLMDGGIRRGGDIVKALSLGARAVLIGRA